MSTDPGALVGKVWNYAHVLRDAGVSSGEYVEQIACLVILKMDQERTANLNLPSMIPEEHRWERLRDLTGERLGTAYAAVLSRADGLLGAIFLKATSAIEDPARLQRSSGAKIVLDIFSKKDIIIVRFSLSRSYDADSCLFISAQLQAGPAIFPVSIPTIC